MTISFPLIVATNGLLLVYVNAPELFELGAVNGKLAFPNILDGMVNVPNDGIASTISNCAVIVVS